MLRVIYMGAKCICVPDFPFHDLINNIFALETLHRSFGEVRYEKNIKKLFLNELVLVNND